MSATIAGIMRMIRISRIENIGSPIGSCGDFRDRNPTISVIAYATSSTATPTAEQIPSRRAVALNLMAIP
jgi:hypothetical protein